MERIFSLSFRESDSAVMMRKKAREHVINSFSDQAYNESFLKLMNEVLGECQTIKPTIAFKESAREYG